MTYKIVAVIWDDHRKVTRSPIVTDPESLIFPTITIGILLKQTKRLLTIVSDIERYEDGDNADYMIILRSCVQGIMEYGEIEIDNLRIAP